jgi:hypothetical protein
MKTEVAYLWRIQWAGRWTTTRTHRTEDEIRREHPEAVRIDGSAIVRTAAESPAEQAELARANSAQHLGVGHK